MKEPIFQNCNVCGRELVRGDEYAVGMCAICANEEIPIKPKQQRTPSFEVRWREPEKGEQSIIRYGLENMLHSVMIAASRDATEIYVKAFKASPNVEAAIKKETAK